jgi:hypothetical protein
MRAADCKTIFMSSNTMPQKASVPVSAGKIYLPP